MNNAEEKKRLRKLYSAARAELKTVEKDEAICRNFLSAFPKERSFFVYSAFRTEAETKEIIRGLLERGQAVFVPKVMGGEMIAVPFSEVCTKNRFGISEPAGELDCLAEIAAVPLLAVDEKGYRLGYGGGYYDRYFAAHENVLRVGLCYAGQAVKELPHEATDIPLHAVVTEEGIRFFDCAALPLRSE